MQFSKALALLALAAIVLPLRADDSPDPSPAEVEEIIRKFAAKETEFARARERYTYRQTVRIEEKDSFGRTVGKYEMVADIIFSPSGKRTERVVYAPVSTLQRILLTPEDSEDLRNVQPFVLTSDEISKYHVRYLGRETLDEISCYVFAVRPKKMEPGKRYFAGIVWVDDQDLQIVKTYGRGVGLQKGDHQYPKFETYRQQIDGRYWFPVLTISENTLNFETGAVPIRMVVKYEDYKQFVADTTIEYGEAVEKPEKRPHEPPKPQPELE